MFPTTISAMLNTESKVYLWIYANNSDICKNNTTNRL